MILSTTVFSCQRYNFIKSSTDLLLLVKKQAFVNREEGQIWTPFNLPPWAGSTDNCTTFITGHHLNIHFSPQPITLFCKLPPRLGGRSVSQWWSEHSTFSTLLFQDVQTFAAFWNVNFSLNFYMSGKIFVCMFEQYCNISWVLSLWNNWFHFTGEITLSDVNLTSKTSTIGHFAWCIKGLCILNKCGYGTPLHYLYSVT